MPREGEPREWCGTNLVQIAVDSPLLAEPADHVIVVAADAKLVPMFEKQRDDGVPVAEICRRAGISEATYSIGARSMAAWLHGDLHILTRLDRRSGTYSRPARS